MAGPASAVHAGNGLGAGAGAVVDGRAAAGDKVGSGSQDGRASEDDMQETCHRICKTLRDDCKVQQSVLCCVCLG